MARLRAFIRRQIVRVATVASDPIAAATSGADRWSPSLKVAQVELAARWRTGAAAGERQDLRDVGFRVFSQFEEDGLLLYVFSVIGARSRTFVDIGSSDGINSNCANLAINHGWDGAFIDANPVALAHGREFYAKHPDTWAWPPRFVEGFVRRDTVNDLIVSGGISGEVDLVSFDIDGNDYWIWEALEAVSPRVVIIETHIEFGSHNIVVPYDPDYVYPGRHPDYHGASAVAMAALAERLGYRLVGANLYGFNTIYVRHGEGEEVLPAVSPESVLAHPRNAERYARFAAIEEWPYVRGGSGFPGEPVRPINDH